MENEFKVGAHTYRAAKMSAFDAFDVGSKFGPVILWLGGMTDEVTDPEQFVKAILASAAPISRADNEFVLNLCLATVMRKQGASWAPVSRGNRTLMFDDLDLREMLEIVWHVLKLNRLIDFFSVSPSTSKGTTVEA